MNNDYGKGLRFKFLFPDFDTFKDKTKNIIKQPNEELFDIVYNQFANRMFKAKGEFRALAILQIHWNDIQPRFIYKKTVQEAIDTKMLTNTDKTTTGYIGNRQQEAEPIKNKYYDAATYEQVQKMTLPEAMQYLDNVTSTYEDTYKELKTMFLPYIIK